LQIYKNSGEEKYVFDEKGLNAFVTSVLTKIPEGIDISELPKEDIEKYIPKKLSVKIMLDINKQGFIELEFTFCYGDFEFNPLENEPEIPRNHEEEKKFVFELQHDGFLYDERNNKMLLLDEEKTYEFLNEKINDYMAKYEVLISEERNRLFNQELVQ